jgi:hypothetical protein
MEKLAEILGISNDVLIGGRFNSKVLKSKIVTISSPVTGLTIEFDVDLSLEKSPPLHLFDLLDDNIIKQKHLEKEIRRFVPLSKERKKRYRAMGCKILGMNHIKRAVIDMEEIHVDMSVQWARFISIDSSHSASIGGSLHIHGWIHNETPIILYELSDEELALIRKADPNSKKKYGVITGHHRIFSFKTIEFDRIMADVYSYENIEALKIWASRLNKNKTPKLSVTKEDVVKAWDDGLKTGIYSKDESSFDEFIDVYGYDSFDPKTIVSLKKRLLAVTAVKDSAGGNVILLDSDTRKTPKNDPRSIYFVANKFDIPNHEQDPFGNIAKDARCDTLWRDHLDKIPTDTNQKIPVTLFVDITKLGGKSLNSKRREMEIIFNNKMSEIAEAMYYTFSASYPDFFKNKDKKTEIELLKKNLPWKFNGFMPQRKTDGGDFMETTIVDADGKEMKNAVYKKDLLS